MLSHMDLFHLIPIASCSTPLAMDPFLAAELIFPLIATIGKNKVPNRVNHVRKLLMRLTFFASFINFWFRTCCCGGILAFFLLSLIFVWKTFRDRLLRGPGTCTRRGQKKIVFAQLFPKENVVSFLGFEVSSKFKHIV